MKTHLHCRRPGKGATVDLQCGRWLSRAFASLVVKLENLETFLNFFFVRASSRPPRPYRKKRYRCGADPGARHDSGSGLPRHGWAGLPGPKGQTDANPETEISQQGAPCGESQRDSPPRQRSCIHFQQNTPKTRDLTRLIAIRNLCNHTYPRAVAMLQR
jgi:hypothetical protein